MRTMDENVTWMKLTRPLSFFSLNLRASFCESTFTSKFDIAFLNVHNRENEYLSHMYIMYANALDNTPYYMYGVR